MMSHAGRRIATTAAVAAAVAMPIAAAGSAFADTTGLPTAGLPAASGLTDGLTQGLPLSGLPGVGDVAGVGSLTDGVAPVGGLTQGINSPVSDLDNGGSLSAVTGQVAGQPVSNLPVVGGLAGNLPVAGSLTGSGQGAADGTSNPLATAISAPQQQAAAAGAQAVQDYTGKHRK
jgi:hypothetical protein